MFFFLFESNFLSCSRLGGENCGVCRLVGTLRPTLEDDGFGDVFLELGLGGGDEEDGEGDVVKSSSAAAGAPPLKWLSWWSKS